MPDGQSLTFAMPETVSLDRVGPAKVTGVLAVDVEIACHGACRLARLAVPSFYRPCIGDTVLVITSGENAYVIGVLEATGPMTLLAPGDLHLRAPRGTIALHAAEIDLNANETRVQSRVLTIASRHLRESFESVRRIVRGVLEIDAGDLRTTVREMFTVVARRFSALAEDDVKIDGKHIHLG
jgi:hypothetical protein